MKPSQEVIDRLLVAKQLLERNRFVPTAHPDRISLAQSILTAHDAAELASAAIAQHLNCLPSTQKTYLMDILSAIKNNQGAVVPHRDYFSQLNSVRNLLKHEGVFPDPLAWYRVGEKVYDYVSEWCKQYLNQSLDELDQAFLIKNEGVKEWYYKAKGAMEQGQYKECLEFLSFAMYDLFRSNPALRNLSIGNPDAAKDALKLAAYGVHANDYLALQEFLPSSFYWGDERVVKWNQKKYGHPGNWSVHAAIFSLKTLVDVALRIQDAMWIPGAIDFDFIYDYKITALEDGVQITEELKAATLQEYNNPRREVVKTLKKDESVRCTYLTLKKSPTTDSPSNTLSDLFGNLFRKPTWYTIVTTDRLSGDVEMDKVKVTCIPKENELVQIYFPGLPEIDYKPS